MSRCLRRVLVLLVVAVLGGVAFRLLRNRGKHAGTASAPPTWPPFERAAREPDPAAADASADWVAPVDGACPEGYPFKANANSGIYHVPGGRFYDRTVPERCYATEAAAERDGYRRSKA